LIYEVFVEGRQYRLELAQKDGRWQCTVDGHEVSLDAALVRPNVLSLIIGSPFGGVSYEVKQEQTSSATYLWIGSQGHQVEVRDPRSLRSRKGAGGGAEGAKKVIAPMPGKVVRVLVKDHDAVEAGQGVVVVEAMKMQNELKAPKQGVIQKVLVAEGASVNAGDVLLVIE
jgi:biotin carboxyl carrier protein